jgi:hypothetical protein
VSTKKRTPGWPETKPAAIVRTAESANKHVEGIRNINNASLKTATDDPLLRIAVTSKPRSHPKTYHFYS